MANKTRIADSSGCFKGLLRRLLCQGSLQTYPYDQISPPELKPEAKIEPSGSGAPPPPPGLVARLMGLDSLPEPNWVRPPELVTRSRSVNFMEYLLEFNVGDQAHHRRVRTSVSFREVPVTLNHQKNQGLFVMCLDEEDEKKMESKERKFDVGLRDLKQKKEEKSKNKKKVVSKFIDEPRRVSVQRSAENKNYKGAKDFGNRESEAAPMNKKNKKRCQVKPMHLKEVPAKGRISNKCKNQLVLEEVKPAQCSSENSSPVSVLDGKDFSIFDDTPLSDEHRCNSNRKSPLMTANCDCPSSSSIRTLSYDDLDQVRMIQKKDYESMDNDQTTEYYSEFVTKLHKFTEQAILQSNWVPEKVLNFEDLEDMCMECGQHILDNLLQQVIDELLGLNMETCAM